MSSIRFVNSIIGNLGAPLRDGPLSKDDDDDRDDMDARGSEHPDLSKNDEELYIGTSTLVTGIMEENVAGPSTI